MMETYVFDGSMEGLLTLIFEWHVHRPGEIQVASRKYYQPQAFCPAQMIRTDAARAARVARGLQQKLSAAGWRRFYCTFLSGQEEAFWHLFTFANYVFATSGMAENNYGHASVLYVSQMARKVEREKHHLEAFIRFEQTGDGLYYAPVEPKYDVLPLLARHFRERYSSQPWVIYDLKRKYGLYYDLQQLMPITLNLCPAHPDNLPLQGPVANPNETDYQELWQTYFNSSNIAARKNMDLHVRNLPRRFWRYLTEKKLN